ncbi:hypothetical protein GGS20DRAFT_585093 [Poronia punctata]|nr:hypothetical protein GGS20DRAFT_585093 [Poronia punctata]
MPRQLFGAGGTFPPKAPMTPSLARFRQDGRERTGPVEVRPIRRARKLLAHGRLRPSAPLYRVSNLLLSLDAVEAKGVQPYDPRLHGVPENKAESKVRELEPIQQRIDVFEHSYRESESNFKLISSHAFHPMQILDHDVLSAFLLRPASRTTRPDHDTLTRVLKINGVPDIIRKEGGIGMLNYMLWRRHQLAELHPKDDRLGLLSHALDKCTNFFELERLVTRTIHSPDGCMMLSEINVKLVELLSKIQVDPRSELIFLSNVALSFDHFGVRLPRIISEYGFFRALELPVIPVAQQFLGRISRNGKVSKEFVTLALTEVRKVMMTRNWGKAADIPESRNLSARLTAVLSLLTGYVPGSDQDHASLGSLVSRDDTENIWLYFRCLARLGAFRSIWHEWRRIRGIGNEGAPHDKSEQIAKLIVTSLVLRKGAREIAVEPGFTSASGYFPEDCLMDMVAISRKAHTLLDEDDKLPMDAQSNSEKLCAIFRTEQHLQHLREALCCIQELLGQHYRANWPSLVTSSGGVAQNPYLETHVRFPSVEIPVGLSLVETPARLSLIETPVHSLPIETSVHNPHQPIDDKLIEKITQKPSPGLIWKIMKKLKESSPNR